MFREQVPGIERVTDPVWLGVCVVPAYPPHNVTGSVVDEEVLQAEGWMAEAVWSRAIFLLTGGSPGINRENLRTPPTNLRAPARRLHAPFPHYGICHVNFVFLVVFLAVSNVGHHG